MNATRFANNLVDDGVEPKLARSLAGRLAEEIDQTVVTKEQVELVVTREVQQLRVEMHQEFQRSDERITARLDDFQNEATRRFDAFEARLTGRFEASEKEATRRFDAFQNQITQRLDSQSRWLNTSLLVLFLAILGNILKDFLR